MNEIHAYLDKVEECQTEFHPDGSCRQITHSVKIKGGKLIYKLSSNPGDEDWNGGFSPAEATAATKEEALAWLRRLARSAADASKAIYAFVDRAAATGEFVHHANVDAGDPNPEERTER